MTRYNLTVKSCLLITTLCLAACGGSSGNGSNGGTEGFFDDDRINQIYRADDPFGEFLDS